MSRVTKVKLIDVKGEFYFMEAADFGDPKNPKCQRTSIKTSKTAAGPYVYE